MSDRLILRLRNPVYVAIDPLLDQPLAIAAMNEAADRIEALEVQIAADTIRLKEDTDVMVEASARIETLEAALNYVADMTYYGAGAEWHFKLGYDPQEVLAALAPEPEK